MPSSAWLLVAGLALAWGRGGAEQACNAAELDAGASPALLQAKVAHGKALGAPKEEGGPLLEEGAQASQARSSHQVRTEWRVERKCGGSGEGCVNHMTRRVHQIWKTCSDGVCRTEECWGSGCRPGQDAELLEERDSAEDLPAPEMNGTVVLETTWPSGAEHDAEEAAEGGAWLEADGQDGEEGDALLEKDGQRGEVQDGWHWFRRHWGWDRGNTNTPQPTHSSRGAPKSIATAKPTPTTTTTQQVIVSIEDHVNCDPVSKVCSVTTVQKTHKVWEHCTGGTCWTEECYGKDCTCTNKVCTNTSG